MYQKKHLIHCVQYFCTGRNIAVFVAGIMRYKCKTVLTSVGPAIQITESGSHESNRGGVWGHKQIYGVTQGQTTPHLVCLFTLWSSYFHLSCYCNIFSYFKTTKLLHNKASKIQLSHNKLCLESLIYGFRIYSGSQMISYFLQISGTGGSILGAL